MLVSGRFLMLKWYLFSFFIVALYCQDLRAMFIIPQMEEPIDHIDHVDFAKTLMALDSGKTFNIHAKYS